MQLPLLTERGELCPLEHLSPVSNCLRPAARAASRAGRDFMGIIKPRRRMKAGLGQRLIDTRLIGAQRPAPLQQQPDGIERESCAQLSALALASFAWFGNQRSFRERRIGLMQNRFIHGLVSCQQCNPLAASGPCRRIRRRAAAFHVLSY
jgi:hypothetical protein